MQKIKQLVISVLKQGLSSHKMALAISISAVIGVFPLWGTTTIINGFVALKFKLNMVVVQVINYLVYPAQFLLIVPEIQLAHALFFPNTELLALNVFLDEILSFNWQMLNEFGFYIFLSLIGWALMSPPMAFMLYYIVKGIYALRKQV